jgi:predicted glycogen debranching enzyme
MEQNEWLVTNGIGGFACGSISCIPSRRYHSYLNAALPEPFGRTIMLNHILESIVFEDNREIALSGFHQSGISPPEISLKEFHLEYGIPVWKYEINGTMIKKSAFLVYRQNTLHISYEILAPNDSNLLLKWRPCFHFRGNEEPLNKETTQEYSVHVSEFQYEIECAPFPLLRIYNSADAPFTFHSEVMDNVYYEIEAQRGYESVDKLISPGYFLCPLNNIVTFIISTETWNSIYALSPFQALITEKIRKKNLLKISGDLQKRETTAKLTLAADQFIISPISRNLDMIRLNAMGEEVKTIIAGFPWFTDWGRDTMISLEGLTLITGRSREAYSILHTFAHYVKDGLVPNMFPDGAKQGIYNAADASLWFFHAIDRYIAYTNDVEILEFLLPILERIIHAYLNGTKFGIRADSDGLIIQGQAGVQLTWMDAKVGDWVVTPRRGKAVEINALWYNALRLYDEWKGTPSELVQQCYHSFNQKFWYSDKEYLYDIIEGENGNDSALRPNQLFAISLKYPVLSKEKWQSVLNSVENNLLTPLGLRTLTPGHPDYKSTYDGDLRSRDAAYHQGTVWPWLLGPYIDVLLKVNPNEYEKSQAILNGLEQHLKSNCLNTIGEIFDAIPPYTARGCFAQAWSVAEFLRCFVKVFSKLP